MHKVKNDSKPNNSEFKSYQMILVKKAFLGWAVKLSRFSLVMAGPLVRDGNACCSQPHTYNLLSGILNCDCSLYWICTAFLLLITRSIAYGSLGSLLEITASKTAVR
jgi:hypothetical protein